MLGDVFVLCRVYLVDSELDTGLLGRECDGIWRLLILTVLHVARLDLGLTVRRAAYGRQCLRLLVEAYPIDCVFHIDLS